MSSMSELIKELRERTGSGFIDCKKALEATNMNLDQAIEWLQKNGIAKAVKKAGKIAAEGLVQTIINKDCAVIFELNSETDYVAKNDIFNKTLNTIGETLLINEFSSDEEVLKLKTASGKTIEEVAIEATSVIGEKISFRRSIKFKRTPGVNFGAYTHFDGQKAALIVAEGASDEVLRDIAMHITAMNPEYLSMDEVPQSKMDEIRKQVAEELKETPGFDKKPENIKENMFNGKVTKALSDSTLLEQEYVKESGKKVSQYFKDIKAKPIAMVRFEVGEGIEKIVVDFAEEVKQQMKK
ncbi:MAG: translation elongation factor Ts [Metamycoplasmataceae bacterium]